MKLQAWQLEAACVLLLVSLTAMAGGSKLTDWLASFAVFLGFVYTQSSFDIADALQLHNVSDLGSHIRAIYTVKELAWVTTFWALECYPLLIGAIVFASYPLARKALRSKVLLERESNSP